MLTFDGRLKRFVKLGGEMISLPAIEAVLLPHFVVRARRGPADRGGGDGAADSPEIVLFTVPPIDRDEVNRIVREAGLSPLYNIRRVTRSTTSPCSARARPTTAG